MREFDLKIVSADEIIYSGKVIYCAITTTEGDMGLEAYHEPFVAVLKNGSNVHYKLVNGEEKSINTSNSMLSFENNSCEIITG